MLPRTKILIVGAGNLLLSDEGFGVHFIRYLERHFRFSREVTLLDAGTMGMFVAHELEQADRVFVIDVVALEGEPGRWVRFETEDFMWNRIPVKLSPHQAGLQEMLLVSELRGRCPREITLYGIIPATFEPGCELSPQLQAKLPLLAAELTEELHRAGAQISPVPVTP